jgi:hypothetical protein
MDVLPALVETTYLAKHLLAKSRFCSQMAHSIRVNTQTTSDMALAQWYILMATFTMGNGIMTKGLAGPKCYSLMAPSILGRS